MHYAMHSHGNSTLDRLWFTKCVAGRSMQCFDAFMFVVAQCEAWFISSFGKTCQWRKRAKPNSSASSVDEMRQRAVRAANISSCRFKLAGGPLKKKSTGGARISKISSNLVARDSITYNSSHQSSSSGMSQKHSSRANNGARQSRRVALGQHPMERPKAW